MSDVGGLILKHFPLAVDCAKGHKGVLVWTIQNEQTDEDRMETDKVERCSHCWMPTGKSEPYVSEKAARIDELETMVGASLSHSGNPTEMSWQDYLRVRLKRLREAKK